MDVGEKRTDDHAETITGDGPCSMLTAGAGAEVFASYKDASTVGGVVEYEILVGRAIGVVAPVAEKVVAEELLLAGCSLQKTGWDYLVGVHIL